MLSYKNKAMHQIVSGWGGMVFGLGQETQLLQYKTRRYRRRRRRCRRRHHCRYRFCSRPSTPHRACVFLSTNFFFAAAAAAAVLSAPRSKPNKQFSSAATFNVNGCELQNYFGPQTKAQQQQSKSYISRAEI